MVVFLTQEVVLNIIIMFDSFIYNFFNFFTGQPNHQQSKSNSKSSLSLSKKSPPIVKSGRKNKFSSGNPETDEDDIGGADVSLLYNRFRDRLKGILKD